MRNIQTGKYLILAIFICLLIAFVFWNFFPVPESRWGHYSIGVGASLIISTFLVALTKKANKKRGIVISYVLGVVVMVFASIYLIAWHRIVCKITHPRFNNSNNQTQSPDSTIVFITGTVLTDEWKSYPSLIRLNKTNNRCALCDETGKINPEEIWVSGSIQYSRYKLYGSYFLLVVSVTVLMIYLAVKILFRKVAVDFGYNTSEEFEDKVFISYNHEDQKIAKELCNALLQHDIALIVDSPDTARGNKVQNMTAGDDIYLFIRKSIAKSRITLMIVSENSLLSGWVATETINTFFLESFDEKKSFIACYIDNSFMDRNFPAKAYTQIDRKLDAIHTEIMNRNKQNVDSRDLNDQKTRLLMLRGNLDKIFQRLQNSLCIEISDEKVKINLEAIVKAIHLKFNSDS